MKIKTSNKVTVSSRSEERLQFRLYQSAVHKMPESIVEKLTRSSYAIGQDLFGRYGSGQSGRSVNRRHVIKQAIRRKRVR